MPPKVALLLCFLAVVFVFQVERSRLSSTSSALFWPLLWYLVVASRPLGVWLSILGVPIPGSSDPTEGSLIDRWFYIALSLIGLSVLSKRHFSLSAFSRDNAGLVILFGFMFISVAWSAFPLVSLKRSVKSVCAVIMTLVVLTEADRLEAIRSLLRRGAYVLIPFSIVLIRYFRDIGLNWNWMGTAVDWIGVATSKNTLGQIAMTGSLIFLWELMRKPANKKVRNISYVYLLGSLYLLKGSDDSISMTSLTVFLIGLVIFLGLHLFMLNIGRIKIFFRAVFITISCILVLLITHSQVRFPEDSILGALVGFMGRDLTLSDRIYIWSDVINIASQSPIFGVGFGAFWIGRIVNIPWADQMTWTLGQAHNGFLDTYLQLGWIGLCILVYLIFSTSSRILDSFSVDFEYARFRMTFFLVTLYVNITESTLLRGDHNMWFVFLLTAVTLPYAANATGQGPASPATAESDFTTPREATLCAGAPGARR